MGHSHILRHYSVLVALVGGVATSVPRAATADVCAYVASVTADQIAVLDVTQRRVAGAIPASGAARSGVTLDGAGHAYVLQDGEAGGAAVATLIDTATHTVTARVALPSCAYGRVQIDTARGRLFVADACDDSVDVLTATGEPIQQLPGCATVNDLIAVPDAATLFVAAPRCDGLRRIDLASLETRVAPLPAEGSIASTA